MSYIVVNTPDPSLVFENTVFVHELQYEHVKLGDCVFACRKDVALAPGVLGLNSVQRRSARVKLGQTVDVEEGKLQPHADRLDVKVSGATPTASRSIKAVDAALLEQHFLKTFDGQVLVLGQQLLAKLPPSGARLCLRIVAGGGTVRATTQVEVLSDEFLVTGVSPSLERFNFRELGIGGLDEQSEQLFRRAFASRILPEEKLAELGVRHVRGVLLHGPPGTGKTLIARKLSEHLTGIQPKVVNGPDILDKYVGESEKNIRALFQEAEQAQRKKQPGLHVIIFDEMDAICKTRGSVPGSGGVGDSVVNQLLTKIDGVDSLDNILVIGLTNRIDLLDRALLRPGRLEVQIEVTLPDTSGRRQILDIHTSRMRESGLLCASFDNEMMVNKTKNFTGAELEAVVKGAASHAMARYEAGTTWQVTHADFVAALHDVEPMFGTPKLADATYDSIDAFPDQSAVAWLEASLRGNRCRLLLTCAEGLSLALLTAAARGAPYTRLLRGCHVGHQSSAARVRALVSAFEDARKSSDSLIVLDDVELLVAYCPSGPTFCHATVQALKALLQTPVTDGTLLHVLGVTPRLNVLEELGLAEAFDGSFGHGGAAGGEPAARDLDGDLAVP